jgi:phosphoribosylanthranilate isomerase
VGVTVKICGLTNADDARAAVAAGADFVGFVFFPASLRRLTHDACSWIRTVDGALKVGVFRDQDPELIAEVRHDAELDLVQLHGHESPQLCAELGGRSRVIKAVSVHNDVDWESAATYAEVARLLFDTASPSGGGTGRPFDWDLLADVPSGLGFWLAGGLTPENVARAVRQVRPLGVDVASGVEAAIGRKDAGKMQTFIAAIRGLG